MTAKSNGTGAIPAIVTLPGFSEKTKKWQMELLMERLRTKAQQHKSFPEMAKAMRMSMLEKRYALDSVEKSNLQKCLDSMQHCIKVTTRQGLIERLESLSRQLGLKFMEDTSGLFISSDMFYLEIILDTNGIVEDVKVHHNKIEQQSCSELVTCLKKGDFADFTIQLEGLSSIYQLNAEIKIKSKAFVALQALETDLYNLFMMQSNYKDSQLLPLLSPVGLLQKRRGGHPMKLTYFVPPYELLNLETKSITVLSVDLINSNKSLGMNVTVNLEASTSNKLQVQPILTFNKDQQGRSSPVYSPLGQHNSIMLPASFVLRLNKPMPLSVDLIKKIIQTTDISFGDVNQAAPLLSLITKHSSDGALKYATKGLFITLPDQNHCYFMTENKNLEGIIVNSVPFTEPSQVPLILKLLRQQALFNTLIASCIRTINNKQDIENTTMFEVSALSCQHLSIALEHPFKESMATVEFNLSECSKIVCEIFANDENSESISMKLSQIVQKCMSIPVTLRALIKAWEQENNKSLQKSLDNGNFNLSLDPGDPGGRNPDFRDIKPKLDKNGSSSGSAGNTFGAAPNISEIGGNGVATNGNSSALNCSSRSNASVVFNQSVGTAAGNSANNTSNSSSFSEQNLFGSNVPETNIFNQIQGSPSVGVKMENNIIGGGGVTTNVNSSIGGVSTSSKEITYGDEKLPKRRRTEDFWKSPKSDLTNHEMLLQHSNNSSDSNSLGKPTTSSQLSEAGVATPKANTVFLHETTDSNGAEITSEAILVKIDSDQKQMIAATLDTDEMGLTRKKMKNCMDKIDNIKDDSDIKQSTPAHSVSITAITSTSSPGLNSVLTGLERRLGIEIIPISTSPAPSIKSSITITPINSSSSSNKSASNSNCDKKNSSSTGNSSSGGSSSSSSSKRSDDRSKTDKKKKRKRDDSPMGPPEKMPPKQDPLSRPVSVSIKTTDGAPLSPSGLMRKFSNTPGKSGISLSTGSISGNSSTALNKLNTKQSSASHSSSPKHQGLASPKSGQQYGTSSPKHSSSGSGKPSMSALKSAANSPSSKGEKASSLKSSSSTSSSSSSARDGSKERDREKDRDRSDKDRSLKYSSRSNSPKLPKSTVKLKQIDLSAAMLPCTVDALMDASSSSQDSNKSSSNQTKNRKSSLSAVIDKLKSAQNASDELTIGNTSTSGNSATYSAKSSTSISIVSTPISGGTLSTINCTSPSSSKDRSSNASTSSNMTPSPKNSEYMVKPSSDGIKITINKTRTKESSSPSSRSSSSSGSNSPKTHTGLKPGVISGPASKKPQNMSGLASQNNNKITGSSTTITNVTPLCSSSNTNKPFFQRSTSSGNLGCSSKNNSSSTSKSNSSDSFSNNSGSTNKKDKYRSSSSSTKNTSSSNMRPDHVDVMKMFSLAAQSQSMEGFMKTFDTKFQIPKLSARSSTSDETAKKESSSSSSCGATITSSSNTSVSGIIKATNQVASTTTTAPVVTTTSTHVSSESGNSDSGNVSVDTGNATKMLMDFFASKDKYGYNMSGKFVNEPNSVAPYNSVENLSKVPPGIRTSATSPKRTDGSFYKDQLQIFKSSSSDAMTHSVKDFRDKQFSISNPTTPTSTVAPSFQLPISFTHPSIEKLPSHPPQSVSPKINNQTMHLNQVTMRPPSAPPMSSGTVAAVSSGSSTGSLAHHSSLSTPTQSENTLKISNESALDFSSPALSKFESSAGQQAYNKLSDQRNTMQAAIRKSTPPSVQVHIVKSPVPSPLVIPSPHSNSSPCITDDELMDEALVGIGSK